MKPADPALGEGIALRLVDLTCSGEVPGAVATVLSFVALGMFLASGAMAARGTTAQRDAPSPPPGPRGVIPPGPAYSPLTLTAAPEGRTP